jgi:hypothetical protein
VNVTDLEPRHVQALAEAAQRYANDGHRLAAKRAARQAIEAAARVPSGTQYLTFLREAA